MNYGQAFLILPPPYYNLFCYSITSHLVPNYLNEKLDVLCVILWVPIVMETVMEVSACVTFLHAHTNSSFSRVYLVIFVLADDVLRPDFCLYYFPSMFIFRLKGTTAQPDDDEKEDDDGSVVHPHRHQ